MAFLTLNGLTVPVVRGGVEQHDAIGFELKRAHTGAPITDNRGFKRKWTFTTPPLEELRAQEIIGLVQGRGLYLPFSTDFDQYATNGAAPATPTWTQRLRYAADLGVVYDEDGALEAYYGYDPHNGTIDAAAAVEFGTTNVLYAIATDGDNIVSGTDADAGTGGFAVIGSATVASSTAASWQGSRSLRITTNAGGDGAQISNATVAANATVTCSVYVRVSNTSITPLLSVTQGAGFASLANGDPVTFSTTTEWRRITLTTTLTGGNTLVSFRITSNVGGGLFVYLDGLQIEEKAYATSWYNGGTRAAGAMAFPATNFPHWGDVTLSCWVKCPTANPAAQGYILMLYTGDTNYIALKRNTSNHLIASLGGNTITDTTSPWDGAWHHVAVTVKLHPESGENAAILYYDGASVGTPLASASGWFEAVTSATLYVANHFGAEYLQNSRVAHVRAVPYAMTAAGVAALYNATAPSYLGATPQVTIAGDVVAFGHRYGATATYAIPCLGEINNVAFVPHSYNSVWRNNGRVIEFTLYEV